MKWRQPRPTSSARTAALVVTALLAIFAINAKATAAMWRITLDGADITGLAAPLDRHSIPLVNVVAIGPAVALAANVLDDQLIITDAAGVTWKTSNGDISLHSDTTALPLKAAMMLQGNAAYLPVDAVAEIANLKLEIDLESRTAILSSRQSDSSAVGDGWEPLVVAKQPSEAASLSQTQSRDDLPTPKAVLPPSHDHIHTSLGLGYVQGTDLGAEVMASGRARGVDAQFNGLLTYGHKGLRPYNSHILLKDRERGWLGEGGGLYSDIYGLAYGVRYARKCRHNHWPTLSLYVKSPGANLRKCVLACRDEVQVTKTLALGGEIASDASYLAKSRLLAGRLSLYGYNRRSSASEANGSGFFASYDIGKGIYLNAGMSSSESGTNSTSWRDISLRFPLTRQMGMTIDHTCNVADTSRNTTNALMVDFPVGPLRLLTRYQIRDSTFSMGLPNAAGTFSTSRQLQTSAALLANSAVNLDYQVSTCWFENGAGQSWQQLVGSFKLDNRTQLQAVMNVPNVFDSQRFRVRLNRYLTNQLSLSVDYGQLTPFQGGDASPGERGLMVMVRRQWNMPTPARGGVVRGVVSDQLQRPMRGAVVTLNQYRVVTDKNGRFECRNLPPGNYEVGVADDSLPADYKCGAGKRNLVIGPRTDDRIEIVVVPLNSVGGRVCIDASKSGEGVRGIALEMDGFPTATGENGSFDFYNVTPGEHVIKLLTNHLPSDFRPASPTEVNVSLRPDSPITGLEFRLVKVEKEILYQDIP